MTTSADGMFAVFSSNRSGATDLWTSTRTSADGTFAAPSTELVAALNSGASELDPELTADNLGLYYAPFDAGQRIVVAHRESTTAPFDAPITLEELQLSSAVGDPSLSPDETVIAFSSGATVPDNELYYATRSNRDAPFDTPVALTALNRAGVSDGDIELASDGCELYFA